MLRGLFGDILEVGLRWSFGARPDQNDKEVVCLDEAASSIFILRNNDLGDVLCTTPLPAALKSRFPATRITVGVGRWAAPIFEHNPHVDEVLFVDAPWYNKAVADRSLCAAAHFIRRSEQATSLDARHFDVGIDVLGSHFGAWLLRRAGIKHIIGVRGYAGGDTLCDDAIDYDADIHVARFALKFAEHLGAINLPDARPQLYLTDDERADARSRWNQVTGEDRSKRRIAIGVGNGRLDKHWPLDRYREFVRRLAADCSLSIALIGSSDDEHAAESIVAAATPSDNGITNLCGRLSLRQTFALVAESDIVACNPSMLMHASAAFAKPAVVLLGPAFRDPAGHYRQWCYPGLSHYPANYTSGMATPASAETMLVNLLNQADSQ